MKACGTGIKREKQNSVTEQSRNKFTHIWPIGFQQRYKSSRMRINYSINGTRTIRYVCAKKEKGKKRKKFDL